MTDIDRILAERYDRRGFMRMAGATTLGAAVLAACKKAEDNGGSAGTSGAADSPGRLQSRGGGTRCPPSPQAWHGRIAQLVEQLTLNQRVPGSSPGASTTLIR